MLFFLRVWKDVRTGGAQTFWNTLHGQFTGGKVPNHIDPEEGLLIAKARNYLGIKPPGYRIS